MKKKVVVGAALMMMPLVSFAGGYLTNTNQHAAFLRSLSRGAAIDIDGALSNPAGLSFLPTDGFRVGVSIQSAFQTRDIDASFGTYNGFDPVNKVPTVSDKNKKKYYGDFEACLFANYHVYCFNSYLLSACYYV